MHRMLPEFVKAAWIRRRQRRLTVRTWEDFGGRPHAVAGSVAIVGNAGYLTALDQGESIDRHDLVIRLNNYRTAGFERQVGTRCDIFLTNFFTDIRFDRAELTGVRHLVASVPNAFRKRRRQNLHHRHAEHIATGMERLARSEVSVPSSAAFAAACVACGAVPSTGLMALRFVVQHLRFERLFVTGYSFFRGPEHYFGAAGAAGKYHDFARERGLVAALLLPLVRSGRAGVDPILHEDLERAA
ncbi:MAG: glycosyltransferase family 29 protein [Planctomycetota bacterium]